MTAAPAPAGRPGERLPHAVLDLPSRRWKALKIERLLGLEQRSGPLRMLEIGTGSGGIANYFGAHTSGKYSVEAVDVVDNRLVSDGYHYTQVMDTQLPFPEHCFDVVLSNHVIEHVGAMDAQLAHLREIRRVLAPGGVAYLAVPNRWMLVEPHYQLIFLSWLPVSWRSPYLRASGMGEVYDCRPLQPSELERMLMESNLSFRNLCLEALRATFEIERSDRLSAAVLRKIPDLLLRPFRSLIPTLIYRIWVPDPAGPGGRAHG